MFEYSKYFILKYNYKNDIFINILSISYAVIEHHGYNYIHSQFLRKYYKK